MAFRLKKTERTRERFTLWNALLPEMRAEVAGHLDPYSRESLRMTCRRYRRAFPQETHNWQLAVTAEWPQFEASLHNCIRSLFEHAHYDYLVGFLRQTPENHAGAARRAQAFRDSYKAHQGENVPPPVLPFGPLISYQLDVILYGLILRQDRALFETLVPAIIPRPTNARKRREQEAVCFRNGEYKLIQILVQDATTPFLRWALNDFFAPVYKMDVATALWLVCDDIGDEFFSYGDHARTLFILDAIFTPRDNTLHNLLDGDVIKRVFTDLIMYPVTNRDVALVKYLMEHLSVFKEAWDSLWVFIRTNAETVTVFRNAGLLE